MAEPVATVASGSRPQVVARQPWDQQPGENERWYARFLRYVALGPSRSLSLLTKGRKNAYPVPAHWPAMAAQQRWKDRALAFDRAIKSDPSLIEGFNASLAAAAKSTYDALRKPHEDEIIKRGYVLPDEEDDSPAVAVG